MVRENDSRSGTCAPPNVNTGTMNAFLKILDAERKDDEHFILILDQAGWHKSRTLKLPGIIRFGCRCDYLDRRAD